MVAMARMQPAAVDEIDMAAVLECPMAAALAVGMGVVPGVEHLVSERRRGEKRAAPARRRAGLDA